MDERVGLIDGKPAVGIFHPTRSLYRYTVLVLISLICFGSYFAYDEIQPLEPKLNPALGIDHTRFGLLYSVYSIPNVILVFFGGILGDKIGLRLAGFIFVLFVLAGSFVTALGPSLTHALAYPGPFGITVAGRVLFGIGGESLNVIQTSMVALWFKDGKELAMAMGLVLSMSRLGDFLALSLGDRIATAFGDFRYALWAGVVLCIVSTISVLIYNLMDKFAEKHYPNRAVDPNANQLNFGAIRHFDRRFWIISFLCLAYYSGVTPFVAVCSDFLTTKFGYDGDKAGLISGFVILAAMILSPVLGKLLDILGRRPYFVVLGSIIIIPAHIILGLTTFQPIVPILMIGVSFSIVPAALWPSVPLIIPDEQTATAFGLMAAIQNSGLAVMNIVVGAIVDQYGYKWALLFFVLMDLVGLAFGIGLIFADTDKKLSTVAGAKAEPIN